MRHQSKRLGQFLQSSRVLASSVVEQCLKGQRIDSETVVVNRYEKVVQLVEEVSRLLQAVGCVLSHPYSDQCQWRETKKIWWQVRFGIEPSRPV